MLYSSRIEFQKWTTVHLHSGITFTFVTLVYSAGSKSVYSLKLHGGKKNSISTEIRLVWIILLNSEVTIHLQTSALPQISRVLTIGKI